MNEKKQSLTDLARVMTRLPQVLINVKDVDKAAVDGHPEVHKHITAVEQQLGQTGRVLLRHSGTEAVVRVMVEAADKQTAEHNARRLADVVAENLALCHTHVLGHPLITTASQRDIMSGTSMNFIVKPMS